MMHPGINLTGFPIDPRGLALCLSSLDGAVPAMGTVRDLSARANHATLVGDAAMHPRHGLMLDGTGDYATGWRLPDGFSGSVTVAAWVRASTPGVNECIIRNVSTSVALGRSGGVSLQYTAANLLQAYMAKLTPSTLQTYSQTADAVDRTRPRHVCAVFDLPNDTCEIYVDGRNRAVNYGDQQAPESLDVGRDMDIGAAVYAAGYSAYLAGEIDDVIGAVRRLSASEILALSEWSAWRHR